MRDLKKLFLPGALKDLDKFQLQDRSDVRDGKLVDAPPFYAVISETSAFRATIEGNLKPTLFPELDLQARAEALAGYMKKMFAVDGYSRPEGFRHYMALLVAMEEHGRTGEARITIDDQCARLGYKRAKNRAYKPENRDMVKHFIEIMGDTVIKWPRRIKDNPKDLNIYAVRPFSAIKAKERIKDGRHFGEVYKIQMDSEVYQSAFISTETRSPQYVKLLKNAVKEKLRDHPHLLILYAAFSDQWRMHLGEAPFRVSMKTLFKWCGLDPDPSNKKRMRQLRDLEGELDYMKHAGYIGGWLAKDAPRPSATPDPLECVIEPSAPDLIKKELERIKTGQDAAPAGGIYQDI